MRLRDRLSSLSSPGAAPSAPEPFAIEHEDPERARRISQLRTLIGDIEQRGREERPRALARRTAREKHHPRGDARVGGGQCVVEVHPVHPCHQPSSFILRLVLANCVHASIMSTFARYLI